VTGLKSWAVQDAPAADGDDLAMEPCAAGMYLCSVSDLEAG
jgi:hypothetical protein